MIILSQTLEGMKQGKCNGFNLQNVNLAELERKTEI